MGAQQDIAELDQCDVGGHRQDRGEQDEDLTDPQAGAHGGAEAGDGRLPSRERWALPCGVASAASSGAAAPAEGGDDGAGDGCGEAPGADDCVRVSIRYPNLPSTLILNGFQNLVRSTLLSPLNHRQQPPGTITVLP